MSIPIEEQETTINFNRKEKSCSIWTCDSTVMTKLDKIYPCIKIHKDVEDNIWAKEYAIPKNLLSFRADKTIAPIVTTKRKLSEKQLAGLEKARQKKVQNQILAV